MNNQIQSRLLILLALAMPVVVQADGTLLDYRWEGALCEKNTGSGSCTSGRHITDGDAFEIRSNANYQYDFLVQIQGEPEEEFTLKVQEICESLCKFPSIKGEFDDSGTEKELTMTLLRSPAHGFSSADCENWLNNDAPARNLSRTQVETECKKDNLVYWHILTKDEGDDFSTMSPPDDGHGTGSGQ